MMDEIELREKIQKIEALFARAGTEEANAWPPNKRWNGSNGGCSPHSKMKNRPK